MKFPRDFVFGVADADLQVIGEANCLQHERSEKSMWLKFAESSGKCHQNHSTASGVDRFTRWPEDVALIQSLGVSAYRTSVSMCRTLDRSGKVNAKAIRWYRDYFQALQKANIKISATLYHWELPEYLDAQGGWTNRASAEALVQHARTVYQELGDLIDTYFVLNEPWCSSILSYYLGVHAPGHQDMTEALLAAHNLLLAQSEIVKFLRKAAPSANISTALNFETAYAASADPRDIQAARYSDGFFNRWFFDPLFLGAYPDDMLALYERWLPKHIVGEAASLKVGADLTSLGVNYYLGRLLRADETNPLGFAHVTAPAGLTNDLHWPICTPPHYPSGLYDALQQIYFSYKGFGLRSLFITENGAAIYSDPKPTRDPVPDARRINYLESHLQQASDAIQRGVPLHGYYLWTLMDNYEWAEGYRDESRFGIVHVDRESMQRTPKQSYYWYRDLIARAKAN